MSCRPFRYITNVYDGRKVVATIDYLFRKERSEILFFNVDREYRCQGIGTKLLTEVRNCNRIYTSGETKMWYEKRGYVFTGKKVNGYYEAIRKLNG